MSTSAHWTSSEDTILTAAIRKYGLYQWSRISSLLPKKTPHQCKARWFNYVNPKLVKAAWSTSDDSKLLKLIKERPNQWTTIAQMLNRSVDDSIQRYRQLMSDITNTDILDTTAPESMPSKSNVTMEDFEMEMVAEAQSRLSTNQGKKPQRKARERQLAQAKQLADIQRKRELEQIGIKKKMKPKSKSQGIDYNAEIPFEHRPPLGRFDTTVETKLSERERFLWEKNIKGIGIAAANLTTGSKYAGTGSKRSRKETKSKTEDKIEELLDADNDDEFEENERIKLEMKKRKKLIFSSLAKENINNDEKMVGILLDLKKRTEEKSVLFAKREPADVLKNEKVDLVFKEQEKAWKKQQKQLKKKLISTLKTLPEPLNDYEIVFTNEDLEDFQIFEEENKVLSINLHTGDSKGMEKLPKIKRDEIKELLKPEAIKRGLPLPRPIPHLHKSDDSVQDAIEIEFQKLITMPELEALENFDMVAYQKVKDEIESEMKRMGQSALYSKELEKYYEPYGKEQLIKKLMLCTSRATTMEESIIEFQTSFPFSKINISKLNELNDLKNRIWVQESLIKQDQLFNDTMKGQLQKGINIMNAQIEKDL